MNKIAQKTVLWNSVKTELRKPCINRESKSRISQFKYKVIVVTWTKSSYQLYHHHKLFIMVAPLVRHYSKGSSHQWTWKVVEGAMLGSIGISRAVISTPSWKYILIFIVCTIGKSPLKKQMIIWEDQVMSWILLWALGTKSQINKRQSFTLLTLLTSISGSWSKILGIHFIYVTMVNRFIVNQLRLSS